MSLTSCPLFRTIFTIARHPSIITRYTTSEPVEHLFGILRSHSREFTIRDGFRIVDKLETLLGSTNASSKRFTKEEIIKKGYASTFATFLSSVEESQVSVSSGPSQESNHSNTGYGSSNDLSQSSADTQQPQSGSIPRSYTGSATTGSASGDGEVCDVTKWSPDEVFFKAAKIMQAGKRVMAPWLLMLGGARTPFLDRGVCESRHGLIHAVANYFPGSFSHQGITGGWKNGCPKVAASNVNAILKKKTPAIGMTIKDSSQAVNQESSKSQQMPIENPNQTLSTKESEQVPQQNEQGEEEAADNDEQEILPTNAQLSDDAKIVFGIQRKRRGMISRDDTCDLLPIESIVGNLGQKVDVAECEQDNLELAMKVYEQLTGDNTNVHDPQVLSVTTLVNSAQNAVVAAGGMRLSDREPLQWGVRKQAQSLSGRWFATSDEVDDQAIPSGAVCRGVVAEWIDSLAHVSYTFVVHCVFEKTGNKWFPTTHKKQEKARALVSDIKSSGSGNYTQDFMKASFYIVQCKDLVPVTFIKMH